MEFKDLYLKRRTCRSYKPIEVEEDKLTYILDAGMHAPVSRCSYNDYLLYSLKGEKFERIISIIKNVRGMDVSYNSKNVILLFSKNNSEVLANQDAGSIIENMCLAASDLDLGSTFSYSVARLIASSKECLEILNVPTDYKILSGMFVGYIDCPNTTNVDHVIKVIK
ncbi:MAG: nitroreductase family protein [Bacilli bacterium]|nr:nitroreductase family protein [Bacilli bacterium]